MSSACPGAPPGTAGSPGALGLASLESPRACTYLRLCRAPKWEGNGAPQFLGRALQTSSALLPLGAWRVLGGGAGSSVLREMGATQHPARLGLTPAFPAPRPSDGSGCRFGRGGGQRFPPGQLDIHPVVALWAPGRADFLTLLHAACWGPAPESSGPVSAPPEPPGRGRSPQSLPCESWPLHLPLPVSLPTRPGWTAPGWMSPSSSTSQRRWSQLSGAEAAWRPGFLGTPPLDSAESQEGHVTGDTASGQARPPGTRAQLCGGADTCLEKPGGAEPLWCHMGQRDPGHAAPQERAGHAPRSSISSGRAGEQPLLGVPSAPRDPVRLPTERVGGDATHGSPGGQRATPQRLFCPGCRWAAWSP